MTIDADDAEALNRLIERANQVEQAAKYLANGVGRFSGDQPQVRTFREKSLHWMRTNLDCFIHEGEGIEMDDFDDVTCLVNQIVQLLSISYENVKQKVKTCKLNDLPNDIELLKGDFDCLVFQIQEKIGVNKLRHSSQDWFHQINTTSKQAISLIQQKILEILKSKPGTSPEEKEMCKTILRFSTSNFNQHTFFKNSFIHAHTSHSTQRLDQMNRNDL